MKKNNTGVFEKVHLVSYCFYFVFHFFLHIHHNTQASSIDPSYKPPCVSGYPGYGGSGMEGGGQAGMGFQQVSQYPTSQYPQAAGRFSG